VGKTVHRTSAITGGFRFFLVYEVLEEYNGLSSPIHTNGADVGGRRAGLRTTAEIQGPLVPDHAIPNSADSDVRHPVSGLPQAGSVCARDESAIERFGFLWRQDMQKQTVPTARYVELLNEEIKRHPYYQKGMQFVAAPSPYTAPQLLDVTWDKEKWSEYNFVFAAAHRVVRARYHAKS
jgi:hypothetical protein